MFSQVSVPDRDPPRTETPWTEIPPPPRTVTSGTVRIQLECILVTDVNVRTTDCVPNL